MGDHSAIVNILDSASGLEMSAMTDLYIRNGNGFIVVYSVTDSASFAAVPETVNRIRRIKDSESVPIILVANKIDLAESRLVSTADGKQLANALSCLFIEVSAKQRLHIDDIFIMLIRLVGRVSEYQFVILGAGGVGKSSITVMYVQGVFVEKYDPTIEDSYRKMVTVSGVPDRSLPKGAAKKKKSAPFFGGGKKKDSGSFMEMESIDASSLTEYMSDKKLAPELIPRKAAQRGAAAPPPPPPPGGAAPAPPPLPPVVKPAEPPPPPRPSAPITPMAPAAAAAAAAAAPMREAIDEAAAASQKAYFRRQSVPEMDDMGDAWDSMVSDALEGKSESIAVSEPTHFRARDQAGEEELKDMDDTVRRSEQLRHYGLVEDGLKELALAESFATKKDKKMKAKRAAQLRERDARKEELERIKTTTKIDNVFTDLETLFFGLSFAVARVVPNDTHAKVASLLDALATEKTINELPSGGNSKSNDIEMAVAAPGSAANVSITVEDVSSPADSSASESNPNLGVAAPSSLSLVAQGDSLGASRTPSVSSVSAALLPDSSGGTSSSLPPADEKSLHQQMYRDWLASHGGSPSSLCQSVFRGVRSAVEMFLLFLFFCLFLALIATILLPAFFVILIIRTTHIETDTKQFNQRQEVIEREEMIVRTLRLVSLFIRSVPVALVLIGFPVLLVLVIVPAALDRTSATDASTYSNLAIGLYTLVIIVLQLLGTVRAAFSLDARKNSAFVVDVDDSAGEDEKKSPQLTRSFFFSLQNWMIILSLAIEFAQISFFPFLSQRVVLEGTDIAQQALAAFNSTSAFEEITKIQRAVYLTVAQVDTHTIAIWVAIGVVCALICVFAFQFTKEIYNYGVLRLYSDKYGGRSGSGDTPFIGKDLKQSARDYMFYSFVGAVAYGHGSPRHVSKAVSTITAILSDGLFLFVTEKILGSVACGPPNDVLVPSLPASPPAHLFLASYPTSECWTSSHSNLATVSLIAYSYYVPISIMLSVMFMEAESEGKDVRYSKLYLMGVNVIKCFMIIAATFLPQSELTRSLSGALACLLMLVFTSSWIARSPKQIYLRSPCSVPFINIWRTITFSAGVYCGICAVVIYMLPEMNGTTLYLSLFIGLGLLLLGSILWYMRWKYLRSRL